MRKNARVAVIVAGGVALAAALAFAVGSAGGFAAPEGDKVEGSAAEGGLSHREALVGLLTLGVIALALFGFDLRDWF
jgi:hypothetical protein